jgi:hypothetical protein
VGHEPGNLLAMGREKAGDGRLDLLGQLPIQARTVSA